MAYAKELASIRLGPCTAWSNNLETNSPFLEVDQWNEAVDYVKRAQALYYPNTNTNDSFYFYPSDLRNYDIRAGKDYGHEFMEAKMFQGLCEKAYNNSKTSCDYAGGDVETVFTEADITNGDKANWETIDGRWYPGKNALITAAIFNKLIDYLNNKMYYWYEYVICDCEEDNCFVEAGGGGCSFDENGDGSNDCDITG